MLSLSIKCDVSKLTKHLRQTQQRLIPTATTQAINAVASQARTESIKEIAKQLRLPERIIRSRFTKGGEKKGDRIEFFRATRHRPVALLRVYVGGIPVYQVAGTQTKEGVKAKGGRLYRGAFKAQGMVFKRRGKARLPLMLPKIGVRLLLQEAVGKRMTGPEGRRRFRAEFTKRLSTALERAKR